MISTREPTFCDTTTTYTDPTNNGIGVIFIPIRIKGEIGKVLSKVVHKFPNYAVLYQEKEVLVQMLQNKNITSIIILDPSNNKELYKDYTEHNNIITIW